MKPILEIRGIEVFYGDIQVLWNVSLQVQEGAIVALVGANGAGKTSLLKAISGLIRPRQGQVLLAGEVINSLPPREVVNRGVVHVPEGRGLFPSLSVMDNLRLGAYISRARPLLAESLELVWNLFPVLESRKGQKAGSLSGGEQQMLAIGRALMSQPRILLLDEPSLGLSPLLVQKVFELIRSLNEEHKMTILLVEQNVRQALKIAHHAFVLKNGRVVMDGPGRSLLADEQIQEAYIGKQVSTRRKGATG